MTQAKTRFASFDEYFEWSNDYPDSVRYELIDGELIELAPESGINDRIANYLFLRLVQIGVPFQLMSPGKCEIQVRVLKPKDAHNRHPDLTVLREEHLTLTQNRLTIKLDMPPPQFVLEVVSPGASAIERDYQNKRDQYANLGIPEYWIVDRTQQTITVFALENGVYRIVGVFGGSDRIFSPTFPNLQLTPAQLFTAVA
jgi:Uma2 family endonuclease